MHSNAPLFSARQIAARVRDLAATINADYQRRPLTVVGVLNGACIFTSDLIRHLKMEVRLDFVRVASYGRDTVSSGRCTMTKDIELDIAGHDLLLVEDIIDTGTTATFLHRHFLETGAASVALCALIDKGERRSHAITIDYTGFTVPEGFLVGYGLDCDQRYRQLPAIYRLPPQG